MNKSRNPVHQPTPQTNPAVNAEANTTEDLAVSTYDKMERHLTTWPTPGVDVPTAKGWAAMSKWVKSHGDETGILSVNALRLAVEEGHLPGAYIGGIGQAAGGIELAGELSDRALVHNNPGLRAATGPLRAVIYSKDTSGNALVVKDTDVKLPSVYPTTEERNAAWNAVTSALNGEVVRVAWVTNNDKVRVVDYLSKNGQGDLVRFRPTEKDDIEHLVVKQFPSVAYYSKEDMAADFVTASTASPEAPVKPSSTDTQAQAQAPKQARPSSVPSLFKRSPEYVFTKSQELAARPRAKPSDETAHILYIFNDSTDFDRKIKERMGADKSTSLAAGIISSYATLLGKGVSPRGQMDNSSWVLLGILGAKKQECHIVAKVPYAGLKPNNDDAHDGAGRVVIAYDKIEELGNPITFALSEVGMARPSQPISLAKDGEVAGFGAPAEARQKIWLKVATELHQD